MLYPVCISRNRGFIKNRTKVFQRARYHQDNLIRRNLRWCCNTTLSSLSLYHDTRRVHTGRWYQQRYWGFLCHPVCYERHCLSNLYFISFHRIVRDILFHCCVSWIDTVSFISICLTLSINCHVLHEIDSRLLCVSSAGPGFFVVCNADNGTVFFHSTQVLGLLCSEFFLQYGLRYI
jgi:hypothetical protein